VFHITPSWKTPRLVHRETPGNRCSVYPIAKSFCRNYRSLTLPNTRIGNHHGGIWRAVDKRFSHGGLLHSVALIVLTGDFSHPMRLTTGCDAGHCPWRTGSTIEGTVRPDVGRLFMMSRIKSRSSAFLSTFLLSVYLYTNPAETSPTRSRKSRASR